MVTPIDHSLPMIDINCSSVSESSLYFFHTDISAVVGLHVNAFNVTLVSIVEAGVIGAAMCI